MSMNNQSLNGMSDFAMWRIQQLEAENEKQRIEIEEQKTTISDLRVECYLDVLRPLYFSYSQREKQFKEYAEHADTRLKELEDAHKAGSLSDEDFSEQSRMWRWKKKQTNNRLDTDFENQMRERYDYVGVNFAAVRSYFERHPEQMTIPTNYDCDYAGGLDTWQDYKGFFPFGITFNESEGANGKIVEIADTYIEVVMVAPMEYAGSTIRVEYPMNRLLLQDQVHIAHEALRKLYHIIKAGWESSEHYTIIDRTKDKL